MDNDTLQKLQEVLNFLKAISLIGTPYADYESDREEAIDTLVDIIYPE